MGNQSLRAGGATAMWQTGYEVEIIKRWGRWESASFQGYLWGDYRILSTIGLNMMGMRGNAYQFPTHGERVNLIDQTYDGSAGRKGLRRGVSGKGKLGGDMSPRDRMRDVSIAMSIELRHVSHASMQHDSTYPWMISLIRLHR